ncbi:MAG TPA: hypothetical protein P5534_06135 [Candidatus Paceibacterota bacterium]|nr:hypothetical protein [Candidatus Paceibacterota bacterium]HRZ58577.1 hypothetical protein [Candidatus Paceibacterota bacterium]
MPRVRGRQGSGVDFRHVIGPPLRKPGAFIHYRHREALYPSATFRAAYDRLVADHGERPGVIEYLQVLKLAAEETVERVEPVLRVQLTQAGKWRANQVRDQLAPPIRKEGPRGRSDRRIAKGSRGHLGRIPLRAGSQRSTRPDNYTAARDRMSGLVGKTAPAQGTTWFGAFPKPRGCGDTPLPSSIPPLGRGFAFLARMSASLDDIGSAIQKTW